MDEAKVAIGGFVVSGGQSEGETPTPSKLAGSDKPTARWGEPALADRLGTNVVKGCRLEDIVHQLMPAAGIGIFNFHSQN